MPVAVFLSYRPSEAFSMGLRIGLIDNNKLQYQNEEKLKQGYNV